MPPKPSQPLLQVETVGEVSVVRFTCEAILEEERIRVISEQLNTLLRKAHRPKILLNFGTVTHLSSAMLGALIRLHKKVADAEGRLALCAIHPEIYEVFKITQLNKILNIYPDELQALESF